MIRYLILALLLTPFAQSQVTESCAGTGALSGNWSQITAGGNTNITRVSGSCQPTSGTQGTAYYTGTTFPNDQQAQAVLTGSIGGSIGVHGAIAGNGVSYLPEITDIYLITAGGGVHSIATSCTPAVVGDTIKLTVVGNVYTAYNFHGGAWVQACQGTDSTYTSGSPYMAISQSTHAGSGFNNFAAGPYTHLAVSPVAVLNGSTGNSITLTGTGTAWTAGTPGTPTFTLSGGTGASITGQTVASTTSATITVNAGSADGNLTITDPSTSETATILVHTPVTYYTRNDGGTRTQCDGLHDAAYSGSGSAQPCAFQYDRMLWADGSCSASAPAWGWVLLAGDTAILKTTGTGQETRVGWSGNGTNPGTDCAYGQAGNAPNSGAPPFPSGTAAHHTRLLGVNYASCGVGQKTLVHGGYAAGSVFNVGGSQYVDIQCLEITDFAQCGQGAAAIGFDCSTSTPLDDFAGNGIFSTNTNFTVTLKDLDLHGFRQHGIFGPPGDQFQLLNSHIGYQSEAGWDMDLADGTSPTGTILIQDTEIEGSGCVEQYPIVATHPGLYCTDQSHGGYGDAIGTATATAIPTSHITCNRCNIHHSTQDGPDFLHGGGAGSSVTVTNSTLNSNMGQQAKLGGVKPTFINNQVNGNNTDMCTPGGLSGWPAGYPVGPGPNLTDCGRGGNIDVLIYPDDGYTSTIVYNSISTNSQFAYYFKCNGPNGGPYPACNSPVIIFQNNAFQGFNHVSTSTLTQRINTDETTQHQAMFNNAGSFLTNNVTNGDLNTCPMTYETSSICAAPGYTTPTFVADGIGNYYPASGSANMVANGVAIPSITTTDILGNARSGTAPTIGAYEFGSAPPSTYNRISLGSGRTIGATR